MLALRKQRKQIAFTAMGSGRARVGRERHQWLDTAVNAHSIDCWAGVWAGDWAGDWAGGLTGQCGRVGMLDITTPT